MSRKLLGVRIPEHLKELVDKDPRPNQQIVTDLLRLEYSDTDHIKTQRKVERQRHRVESIRSQLNEVQHELETELNKLEMYESHLETMKEQQESDIRAVARGLDVIELKSTNGPVIANDRDFIEGEAERIGCSVRELKEAALEEYDE